MKSEDGDKTAFPTVAGHTVYSNGMTLRDYFAGQALAGMMANLEYLQNVVPADAPQDEAEMLVARQATRIADAMLKERSK